MFTTSLFGGKKLRIQGDGLGRTTDVESHHEPEKRTKISLWQRRLLESSFSPSDISTFSLSDFIFIDSWPLWSPLYTSSLYKYSLQCWPAALVHTGKHFWKFKRNRAWSRIFAHLLIHFKLDYQRVNKEGRAVIWYQTPINIIFPHMFSP